MSSNRNGRQTEDIIAPEIPAITLPPAVSINNCKNSLVSKSISDDNKEVVEVVRLAAKNKLFKSTRKVPNLQDDKSNSNSVNEVGSEKNGKLSQNNGSSDNVNGKLSKDSTCVESSSSNGSKNLTSKLAGVNSSRVNFHNNGINTATIQNEEMDHNHHQKDYFDFHVFEKSLETDVPQDYKEISKNGTEDGIQTGSKCNSLTKSFIDWTGNNYNNIPLTGVEDYCIDNSNRILNEMCSSQRHYPNHKSTDIEIDIEDDEDEAEEILGLDLHNDSDDINPASGANLNVNLKYLSNSHYSGVLFPNPSSTSSNYNHPYDICPTTTATTTISHSEPATSFRGNLSSYVLDDHGRSNNYSNISTIINGNDSSCGGITPCSSIWDGINQLCEVENCPNPASKKCKSCKAAFYCSESHQKENWKKHKNNCIPFRMETTEYGGEINRHMVAVRNIPAGFPIFAEKPFLVFPVACTSPFTHIMDFDCVKDDLFHLCPAKPACLGCMKIVEFDTTQFIGPDIVELEPSRHQCSRCSLPLCSESCEHEIAHMLGECFFAKMIREQNHLENRCFHSLYMDVEILRALHLENHDRPQWEQFLELRNHNRVINYKRYDDRFANFVQKVDRLVPLSIKVSAYNYDLICDCHAIITALSYKPTLQSPYKMLIGTQLNFAHDCIPNTLSYVEEQMTGNIHRMRCVVKSAVTIMKGELITMDFVPTPYLPYPLRLKVLQNMYLECNCRRCIEPSILGDHSNDIQCSTCRRGSVVPESPRIWKDSVWSCRYCQEEVSYSHVNKIYHQWKNKLAAIPKCRQGLDQLMSFIREASVSLNKTHELVIMAWCFVETILRPKLEVYRTSAICNWTDSNQVLPQEVIDDFILLDEYCTVSDEHFKAIRPGIWLDRAIVLFNKFYASFVLASYEYQKQIESNSLENPSLPRKEFITQVLRSMKALQKSLEIFLVYESYNASQHVRKLTEQANWTLHTVKEYAGRLIKEDSTFATTTVNSFRRLI